METLQLLSLTKSARLLHIGKDSLNNLIHKGRLKIINIGKRRKISASELQRFIDEEAKVDLSAYSIKPLISNVIKNKNDFSGKDIFRNLLKEDFSG